MSKLAGKMTTLYSDRWRQLIADADRRTLVVTDLGSGTPSPHKPYFWMEWNGERERLNHSSGTIIFSKSKRFSLRIYEKLSHKNFKVIYRCCNPSYMTLALPIAHKWQPYFWFLDVCTSKYVLLPKLTIYFSMYECTYESDIWNPFSSSSTSHDILSERYEIHPYRMWNKQDSINMIFLFPAKNQCLLPKWAYAPSSELQ